MTMLAIARVPSELTRYIFGGLYSTLANNFSPGDLSIQRLHLLPCQLFGIDQCFLVTDVAHFPRGVGVLDFFVLVARKWRSSVLRGKNLWEIDQPFLMAWLPFGAVPTRLSQLYLVSEAEIVMMTDQVGELTTFPFLLCGQSFLIGGR